MAFVEYVINTVLDTYTDRQAKRIVRLYTNLYVRLHKSIIFISFLYYRFLCFIVIFLLFVAAVYSLRKDNCKFFFYSFIYIYK